MLGKRNPDELIVRLKVEGSKVILLNPLSPEEEAEVLEQIIRAQSKQPKSSKKSKLVLTSLR